MHRYGRIVMFLFMLTLTVFPASAAEAPAADARRGEQRLLGRWVRPDGGYVLELSKVRKDGTLEAGYYNPRPIHVARAEWKRGNGTATVHIELRDVNYPGSRYDLRYDPESDSLKGTYFQAVERKTYEIGFERR